MSNEFNEYSETGRAIQHTIETVMLGIEAKYKINHRNSPHDIARWFLNEIYEFKPAADTGEDGEV